MPMPKEVICWNCDYFQPAAVDENNTGWCRRKPPRGIDQKSITEPVNTFDVFPPVEDGIEEWCGDFKLNHGVIPPQN
jgi:hypothetical protein